MIIKTTEPIGCYKDVMINQRKLMFKKNIYFELDFQPNAQSVKCPFHQLCKPSFFGQPSRQQFSKYRREQTGFTKNYCKQICISMA